MAPLPPDDEDGGQNEGFDVRQYKYEELRKKYDRLKDQAKRPEFTLQEYKKTVRSLENRIQRMIESEKQFRAKFPAYATWTPDSGNRMKALGGMLRGGIPHFKSQIQEREEAYRKSVQETRERKKIQKENLSLLLSRSSEQTSGLPGVLQSGTSKELKQMVSELKKIRLELEQEMQGEMAQKSPVLMDTLGRHLNTVTESIRKGESGGTLSEKAGRAAFGMMGPYGKALMLTLKGLELAGKGFMKIATFPSKINNMVSSVVSGSNPTMDYIQQTSMAARISGMTGNALRGGFGSVSGVAGGSALTSQMPPWMRKYRVSQTQAANWLEFFTGSGASITGNTGRILQEVGRNKFLPGQTMSGFSPQEQLAILSHFQQSGILGNQNPRRFMRPFGGMMGAYTRAGISRRQGMNIFQSAYGAASAGSVQPIHPEFINELLESGANLGIQSYRTPQGAASLISGIQRGADTMTSNPGALSFLMAKFPGLGMRGRSSLSSFRKIMGMAHHLSAKDKTRWNRAFIHASKTGNVFENLSLVREFLHSNLDASLSLSSEIGKQWPGMQDMIFKTLSGMSMFEITGARKQDFVNHPLRVMGRQDAANRNRDMLVQMMGGKISKSSKEMQSLAFTGETTRLGASINVFESLGKITSTLVEPLDKINSSIIHMNSFLASKLDNILHALVDSGHTSPPHHEPPPQDRYKPIFIRPTK